MLAGIRKRRERRGRVCRAGEKRKEKEEGGCGLGWRLKRREKEKKKIRKWAGLVEGWKKRKKERN